MAAIIGFERYHHYIRRLFLLDEQGIPEKGFSQRLNELGARGVGSYRTLRDLTELFLVSRCGPAAIDEGFDASPLLAFDSPERRRIGEEIEERLRNYLHHGEFPYIERVVKAAYPWLGGHEGRGLDDRTVEATLSGDLIVGRSEVWRALLWRIIEAAAYSRVPILLTGESGTGKELLARLVSKVTRKAGNLRATGPDLVTLDCGTLVPELSGSKFFGHERGAFTGAHVARDGAFALSNGVTLLLDEIGEIPLHLQPQILRCIQEGAYKRLGSNVWQKSDFRLVSATNCDLEQLVSRQQFRLDLYYRIAGCIFQTPPLRERREDMIPFA